MPPRVPRDSRIDTDELAPSDDHIDLSNPVHRIGLLLLALHYLLLNAILFSLTPVGVGDLLMWLLVLPGVVLLVWVMR